jgi:hypothetical protein
MEYILQQTGYYPISLGANCFPRMYLDKIYKSHYPRLPFDYVGTPMWGINEAITSNFKKFASKDSIVAIPLYRNNTKLYLINILYDISFLHDHKNYTKECLSRLPESQYYKVETNYSRRIQRWNSLVTAGSKLLFFRLERIEENRIQNIHELNKPSEKDSLEEFSRMMKEKGIEFRIIYFTYNCPNQYDSDTRIIYVNIPKEEKITDSLINTLFSSSEVLNHVRNSLLT